MIQLTQPDKNLHQYVVGIDFGHGETSAAICPLEWDTKAGNQMKNFSDIEISFRDGKKSMTSAICVSKNGTHIGGEAFEHTDSNNKLRLEFKTQPASIDGEAEKLMTLYMKAVYARIREIKTELTDTNHIVYLARPSGWQDTKAKETYQQMAINAGIPLGGLTSESRAAIFYAKTEQKFKKEIKHGAIVFDIGSSTIDLTYISDETQPIDFGYNLGASIIDHVIFNELLLKNEKISSLLAQYPVYHDAMLYVAREFKEFAYGRDENAKSVKSISLAQYISEDAPAYQDFSEESVILKINNLAELNKLVEEKTNYTKEIERILLDFREKHIANLPVTGVILTGGASRMNFLNPVISKALELPSEKIWYETDDASLTVSRGISLLGAADAYSNVLVGQIRNEMISEMGKDNLYSEVIDFLAQKIPVCIWPTIQSATNDWLSNSTASEQSDIKKELFQKIEKESKNYLENNLGEIVSETLQYCIVNTNNDLRERINQIIRLYDCEKELTHTQIAVANYDMDFDKKLIESIKQNIDETLKTIGVLMGDIVLLAITGFTWLYIRGIIWIFSELFTSAEYKRKKFAQKILDNEIGIKEKMSERLNKELNGNEQIKDRLRDTYNSYIIKLLDFNLNRVRIPIE